MKIGSKLQFEVPDKCPKDCPNQGAFYQGGPCYRCPVLNCGKTEDGFCLIEAEDYRDDWAELWEEFFKNLKRKRNDRENKH